MSWMDGRTDEQLRDEILEEAVEMLDQGHPWEERPYTAPEYVERLRSSWAARELRRRAASVGN